MHLRDYIPKDLPELYELFYETVHRVNIRDYTQAQTDAWAPKQAPLSFFEGLQANFTRLAESNGQIVGYVELTYDGLVHAIYVHHQWQGRGVGKLLMEEALKEAKSLGLTSLFLEASLTAHSFYEKMGFVTKEVKTKACRGEQFAVILMELPLSS